MYKRQELGKTLGIDPEKVDYYEKEFDKIPELMEQAIHMTEEKMKGMAERLYSKKMFFFCGGGPFFTCAEYGSAKVKEATPVYAMPDVYKRQIMDETKENGG